MASAPIVNAIQLMLECLYERTSVLTEAVHVFGVFANLLYCFNVFSTLKQISRLMVQCLQNCYFLDTTEIFQAIPDNGKGICIKSSYIHFLAAGECILLFCRAHVTGRMSCPHITTENLCRLEKQKIH